MPSLPQRIRRKRRQIYVGVQPTPTNSFPDFDGAFNFYVVNFSPLPPPKNREFLNGTTYVVPCKKVSPFHQYFVKIMSQCLHMGQAL